MHSQRWADFQDCWKFSYCTTSQPTRPRNLCKDFAAVFSSECGEQSLAADLSAGSVQDNSLLQMPPWCNPWLLCAMALSFGLHFVILYVPVLAKVFSIVPLSLNEWLLVVLFALPVVLIDEVLKFVGRNFVNPTTASSRSKAPVYDRSKKET